MTSKWVGFDFDGTIAVDDFPNEGKPVDSILNICKHLLNSGVECRIVTARAHPNNPDYWEQIQKVKAWCIKYLGEPLTVTCEKDINMALLFDDRAVAVESSTGKIVGCGKPRVLQQLLEPRKESKK